jgi:hypothetical protein
VGGGRKAARLRERLLRKPENEVVSALRKNDRRPLRSSGSNYSGRRATLTDCASFDNWPAHDKQDRCSFCLHLVCPVKALLLVNRSPKLVTINGTIRFGNADSTFFQARYYHRGRDSNACINFAMARLSQLISENRETLPPYRKLLRPSDATPTP